MDAWPIFIVTLLGHCGVTATREWIKGDERKRFPELALLENEALREFIWKRAEAHSWRMAISAGVLATWFVPVFWLDSVIPAAVQSMPLVGPLLAYAYMAVGLVVSSLVAVAIARRNMLRVIRIGVCAAGIPVCIACGYQTRELPMPRCPECGCPIRTGMCARCAGAGRTSRTGIVLIAGVVLVVLTLVLVRVLVRWSAGMAANDWIGVATVTVVCGIALVAGFVTLMRCRTRPCPDCGGTGKPRALPPLPSGPAPAA